MEERRASLQGLARGLDLSVGGTGAHPWSRWQDQRIIDTPHYRRNDEILRYVVWRNNTFGLHVHVGIRGRDRAIAVHNAARNFLPELLALSASSPFVESVNSGLHVHVGIRGRDRAIAVHNAARNFLPELLALSASSPFVESVNSGLHSARTEIFTRMFPRCGIPDTYDGWHGFEDYVSFLYRTGSITEHTQIWWSIRPHLAFPTVEVRIADAQPDLGEAQALAALAYAIVVRTARAHDEGEPLPDLPHRLLEENLWRAIRYGLSGELIDFGRGEPVPARARLEQLLEWVAPVADEIGAAPFLVVPERNAAERQIVRWEEGASLEEIYAEQVRAGERIG
jgi:carboxylate-amine ligase